MFIASAPGVGSVQPASQMRDPRTNIESNL